MKYLVTYWSQTGNTKKVAENIFDALPGVKILKPFDEIEHIDGFDVIFIGFPVMQLGPPPVVKKFLSAHTAGKTIALFVTHAMLTRSDDLKQQAMLVKELDKCRDAFSGFKIIGIFHCQGELSEKIASELTASEIPILMEFAAMRPNTLGHPDAAELEQARIFALKIVAP